VATDFQNPPSGSRDVPLGDRETDGRTDRQTEGQAETDKTKLKFAFRILRERLHINLSDIKEDKRELNVL
jgi:hypothetical protein